MSTLAQLLFQTWAGPPITLTIGLCRADSMESTFSMTTTTLTLMEMWVLFLFIFIRQNVLRCMRHYLQAAVYAETWGDNYNVNLNDFAYKASSVRWEKKRNNYNCEWCPHRNSLGWQVLLTDTSTTPSTHISMNTTKGQSNISTRMLLTHKWTILEGIFWLTTLSFA